MLLTTTLLDRWITFAPCLYIFVQYYFQHESTSTINAIHSLSSVYMMVYPFAIQFTFKYFEDRLDGSLPPGNGLRRGILIGACLNAVAGGVRWLGAIPSMYGFSILFLGQTIAAIGKWLGQCLSYIPVFNVSSFISTGIHVVHTASTCSGMVSRKRNQCSYFHCCISQQLGHCSWLRPDTTDCQASNPSYRYTAFAADTGM